MMVEFPEIRPFKVPPMFWRPRPKPDTPNLIMMLPPELRNRVYMDAVPRDMSFDKKHPAPGVPLLRVSKQIRVEAACVFYGNNRFCIHAELGSKAFDAAIQKCRAVVNLCGPRTFCNLSIRLADAESKILPRLKYLLPFLDLMREIQFEPKNDFVGGDTLDAEQKARSVASGSSLFELIFYPVRKEVLGRAIALGRRARDERWSREKLEERYAAFVAFVMKGPTRNGKRSKPWPITF